MHNGKVRLVTSKHSLISLKSPHKVALFNDKSLKEFLNSRPESKEMLGPDPSLWSTRETGDGNLNFVFIVEGPTGTLVVKQALHYIRCVGESWPLTKDRLRIEYMWLGEMHEIAPDYVPNTYLFDRENSAMVMEYMPPPFRTLRSGILDGETYPNLPFHIGDFLAKSLFFSSALGMESTEYRQKTAAYCNPEMCKATEQVIFLDAYYDAPSNAYLKPELEDVANDLRNDVEAKIAIGRLRNLFLSKPQALIHGDFHTGSVMVSQSKTLVFDSEFAFYGPMAFDIGKFLGNLLLTYFALDGHLDHPREKQQTWILDTTEQIWSIFRKRFLELWNENKGKGDAYPIQLISNPPSAFDSIQRHFMNELFPDVIRFAGACMIRRLITVASVEDYTTMQDRNTRVLCTKRALKLGKQLLVETDKFQSIKEVVQAASTIKTE